MKHLGDITKISGATVPMVDVIVGGSPCQDLSVAGKREGLGGARSGLFMEQIRIIKEMRNESIKQLSMRGTVEPCRVVPRFMVWENVPGAFTSNNGEDFRTVLEETAKVADQTAVIPRLEGGKNGQHQGAYWQMGGLLLGEYTMRSFGECPKEEKESHLLQILEDKAPAKYYLSERACRGILRRAKEKGKTLPTPLYTALIRQSHFKSDTESRAAEKEY